MTYAAFLRCLYRYSADPAYRRAADTWNGEDDALVLRAIRAILFAEADPSDPYVAEFMKRQSSVSRYIDSHRGPDCFASGVLYLYEENEKRRAGTECARIRSHRFISYYPAAFELSDGCSVQCPFCGFAAAPHRSDFLYTEENARLFSDVISVCRRILGPVTGLCPLYFATEPLDNPDYIRFLADHARLTDGIPQTTTAIADTRSEQVKELMSFIGRDALRDTAAIRFSVRTLGQLRRLEELYTDEETEYIEFICNNPESVNAYSDSGKAQYTTKAEKRLSYSICCVSGLLVSFPRRTVSFITPEIPDEAYPKGYRVLETLPFEDGASFERAAVRLIDDHAITQIGSRRLTLNKNIRLTEENGRYVFAGDGIGYQIGKNLFTARLADAFRTGKSFPEALDGLAPDTEGAQKLYNACMELFERGYIRILY